MSTRTVLVITVLFCSLVSGSAQTKSPAATEMVSKPVFLTKADFLKKVMNYQVNPREWIYLGDKPCLIDYYASWCGPCKRLSPILDELAREYAGQIYIYKIDVDREPELAALFAVQSIPTLIFCPIGDTPQLARGLLPKETLRQVINEVLLKKAS
ncbi:MAG: thioredoxin [Prevotellaceae bacterium]|jgi:thioredoxin|nr:thioredoxin [Prevotellaceae bacterium]